MKKAGKLANGQEYTILDFVLVLNHKVEDLKNLQEEFVLMGAFERSTWDAKNSKRQKYIEYEVVERISVNKAQEHSGFSVIPVATGWFADRQPLHFVLCGKISDSGRNADQYPITDELPVNFDSCSQDPSSQRGEKERVLFSSIGSWQLSPKFSTDFDDIQAIHLFRYSIPAFFEMHSHIESNHCSPMPPAWVHVWDGIPLVPFEMQSVTPGYKWQDSFAFLALGEGADIGKLPTSKSGEIFIQHVVEAKMEDVFPFLRKGPQFSACLMPMDLDYMHYNGYFGVPVSCLHLSEEKESKTKKLVRWYNWDAAWGMRSNNEAPSPFDRDPLCRQAFVKNPESTRNETWCYMASSDSLAFEPWYKQHKAYEEMTAKSLSDGIKGANFLPFFHFEPRRFTSQAREYGKRVVDQAKESAQDAEVLKTEFDCISSLDQMFGCLVQSSSALKASSGGFIQKLIDLVAGDSESQNDNQAKPSFFGIKLYTTLGWAPEDPYLREPLEEFYRKSEQLQIPLLNHCTPAGYYTHDRRHYFDLLEADGRVCAGANDEYENGWKKKFSQEVPSPSHKPFRPKLKKNEHWWESREEERLWWYIQQYVSPRAWRSVIEKHKKLKLCLAHFGDSDHLMKDSWGVRKVREPHETIRGHFDPKKHLRIKFDGGKIVKQETHSFLYEMFDLIDEGNRVFVDLSYVILSDNNAEIFNDIFRWARKSKPILLERILWGTDWPLIAKQGPVKSASGGNMLHRYAKAFRDAIPKMPGDFFLRAAFLNPLQYLNIKAIHEKMIASDMPTWFEWCEEYPSELFDAEFSGDKAAVFYKSLKGLSEKSI